MSDRDAVRRLGAYLSDEAAEIESLAPSTVRGIAAAEGVSRAPLVEVIRLQIVTAHRARAEGLLTALARAFGLQPTTEFAGADLSSLSLIDEQLADADLTATNLRASNLTGASLERARLDRADLSDAVLARANLRGASLVGARLDRANLAQADLTGAALVGVDFSGVDLTEVIGIEPPPEPPPSMAEAILDDPLFRRVIEALKLPLDVFVDPRRAARSLTAERSRLTRAGADPAALARAGLVLALTQSRLGRLAKAREHLAEALSLYEAAGDAAGVAIVHWQLATILGGEPTV